MLGVRLWFYAGGVKCTFFVIFVTGRTFQWNIFN